MRILRKSWLILKSKALFHQTVLLQESIALLNIKADGVYVDMTLGAGGHAQAIMAQLSAQGLLIGFDQDQLALANAVEKFKNYQNFKAIHANFKDVAKKLRELNITKVDGFIYDLGVSSMQVDTDERGFSFHKEARLDMRMNQEQELSAWQVVNEYSYAQLCHIISCYGEEKNARLIARSIVAKRPLNTTLELVDAIKQALPQKVLKKKGHPAKQTFQALRIEVNKELDVIETSLQQAIKLLNDGGRIVVISFHSLEDRLVKNIFKEYTTSKLPKELVDVRGLEDIKYRLVNKKVILPSAAELDNNRRAHSSKLRCLEKIDSEV